jgi:hypothetical protein
MAIRTHHRLDDFFFRCIDFAEYEVRLLVGVLVVNVLEVGGTNISHSSTPGGEAGCCIWRGVFGGRWFEVGRCVFEA